MSNSTRKIDISYFQNRKSKFNKPLFARSKKSTRTLDIMCRYWASFLWSIVIDVFQQCSTRNGTIADILPAAGAW
jgi:hypothetical protein